MRRQGGTISVLWGRSLADRDVEYRVVASYSPGHPGQLYGPPENCYPPESPEVEYTDVFEVEGKTEKRIDLSEFIDSLTDKENDALQDCLIMEADERGTDQEAEAVDRKYDDWKDRQYDKEQGD